MTIETEHGFYLGARFDPKQLSLPSEKMKLGYPFQIAPFDLLTHAIILGMTGSGKTVLGKIIIEEAALRGIPSVLIDLKGDLASMGLVFPSLKKEDFVQWVRTRKGVNKENVALELSQLYEYKLQKFNIPKERLEEFNEKTKIVVLTPRSTTGVPLAISSLPKPPPNVKSLIEIEPETILDLIDAVVRTLTMRIFPGDPPEKHIVEEKFLSSIVRYSWENDIPLEGIKGLETLVELVENPPMKKIGVMDVNRYIPPRERHELAIYINNLLVGAEQLWHFGIPLDINKILDLYSRDGKIPIVIFSLGEISIFEDKIFAVSRIAYGVYEWMRRKGGSEEPRLIFYIDEIGGGGGKTAFFPIHPYNPPSKPPLMLLIKQARAFGVSCVFSTQNPGDIDYKGLSNCGTWIIGRLSTARDREKVLQGLGDIELFGTAVNRRKLERQIASLESGEFVCKTKQGDIEFFKERWLMSYHKTLTPREIKKITTERDRISRTVSVLSTLDKRSFLKLNHPPSMEEIRRHFREETNIQIEKAECAFMPLLSFKITMGFRKTHPLFSGEVGTSLVYGPMLVPLSKDNVDTDYASKILGINKIMVEDLSVESENEAINAISRRLTTQAAFEQISDKMLPSITQKIVDETHEQIRKERKRTIDSEKADSVPKLDELDFKKQNADDRITDLKEKKNQIEDELIDLESEKSRRLIWGEPVARITQSINSRERKIRKIDRQIVNLKTKIETLDSQKDRLLDSQNRKIKSIKEQFDRVEKEISKEIAPKLAFEEVAETFIPICNAAISIGNHKRKKHIQLQWNGYNGTRITTFPCHYCGIDLKTSHPLNSCSFCSELLCDKHTLICSDCSKIVCKDHIWICNCNREHCFSEKQEKCQECETLLCATCKQTCEICDTMLCPNHLNTCTICEKIVCRKHSWTCDVCDRTYCRVEESAKCSVGDHSMCANCKLVCEHCGEIICSKHSVECHGCRKTLCNKENHFTSCMQEGCQNLLCYTCLVGCEGCKKPICSEHSAKCPNCGKLVCRDCERTQKRFLGLSIKKGCTICMKK